MERKIHPAHYRSNESIEEFCCNPLIEALPDSLEPDEAISRLMICEPYSDGDRFLSVSRRQMLTQRIARFHQPMNWDVDIYERIDRCIRWGYADRNPVLPAYAASLAGSYDASLSGEGPYRLEGYHPHTYGFSVLGISGIGKSTTIESILSLYPQVIRHESYRGIPLVLDQVVWLKLDCSCDGSLKGLCMDFFRTMDEILGTSYSYQYRSRRATLDQMMIAMSRLCSIHSVGLLIIDEIQSLCTAASGVPEKVLNFLVTLVNTIGIPVITIGTPKALSILQKEFQQAKRGSGQGDALWERMKNDALWEVFCTALWNYQYTRTEVAMTGAMKDALYEEAQGIPFVAVHLYKLVQEDAILSGKEKFAAADFHRIAADKMKLTKPMREAMKHGTEVDLKQFLDITPFNAADYKDNYSIAAEAVSPVPPIPPRISVQEEAVVTLMGMGLDKRAAELFVCEALSQELSGCPSSAIIARKAFMAFLASENKPAEKAPAADTPCGYDALKKAGMIDDDKRYAE